MRRQRNKAATMSNIDDIVMMILGLSEALHSGDYAIGYCAWDHYRPNGWPTARYVLRFYGFEQTRPGWEEFIRLHTGLECMSINHIRIMQGEKRMAERWNMDNIPDYTARPDEYYQAATWDVNMPICEKTYLQTGRMVLR